MFSEHKSFLERLKRVFNNEFLKRSMIKYFTEKGFDNFNKTIYAPVLQDLPYMVPELLNKVEIVPYVKETNPATGQFLIGWNLFVIGMNRMDLGDSFHNNMNELKQAVNGPPNGPANYNALKSPKDIIDFIMAILENSRSGLIQPQQDMPNAPSVPVNRPKVGPTGSGGYYEKNRPAN